MKTKALAMIALIMGTAMAAWLVWPRPSVTIHVQPGGQAMIVPKYGGSVRATIALPETLFVEPGGLIRLVNSDSTRARIGIIAAPAKTTRLLRAPMIPGTFDLECTAHPDRAIRWVVGAER